MPFAGRGEALVIALVAGWFIASLARAVVAIRQKQVARHREWMIRAASVALGISIVRLVAAGLDLVLLPAAIPTQRIFVLSISVGWAISIGASEWWIRRTRPRARMELAPARRQAA